MSHIIHYVTTNFKKIFHTVCTEIISCIQGTALHFVLVAAFLGTLNHFLYFLFVSIWEYLSLHPVVLPFFYCRYLGVLLGMFFTVSVFYTYSGILGRNFLILDILLFYSSVIFSFGMSEYISGKTRSPHETEPGFVVSLWLITSFFFFVFTCFPPDLPLFYSA